MAKLNTGTRIYGTANVDTQINIGANVVANTIAFAIGTAFIANTTQVTLSGIPLSANAGVGTSGQSLLSNGATGSPYWGTVTATPGATYVQNTDSRTLSGNLVISGTYFNPSANTILLGNSISRWVVSANTGDFSGTVTGTVANMSTSVNSALLTVGTSFIANTTGAYHSGTVNAASHTIGTTFIANTLGVYHSGLVNAASFTTTGFVANTTVIAPTSNTILLGNTIGRFIVSANTGDFSGTVTGTVANMSTSVNSALLTVGTSFIANTTGAYHTGTVNAVSFTSGTINATSNGLISNSTTITIGNSSVNVAITTAGITSAGGTGVNPSSNTVGTALGTNTQRWVLNANTGSFAGAVSGITTLAAGNTTVTGFVNATSTIQGGSSLTIAGAASGITTLAAGNTTITGFVNATSTIQGGSSLTIAGAASGITTLAAGNTTITGFVNATSTIQGGSSLTIAGAASGITTLAAGNTTITGFANASVSVNSALLTVGTSFIANTLGAYHTGTVNAASHTVGSSFIANSSAVVMPSTISIVGGGATGEGGQIVLGYGNNLAASIVGQANNTFNLDITGGNTASTPIFRAFFQNADATTTAGFNVANTGRMHVGSLAEQTDSTFKVTGTANVTTSVNSALLTVGTAFIANSTAIVGTGFANVTTSVNSALLTVGTSFIANTTGTYHTSLVNSASYTIGSSFIANTLGTYHTGIVNAASHTTTGFVANTTAIAPTSNTILLGNTIGRFVLSANTGDFSGTVTATSFISTVTGTNSGEILRGNMADNDQFRILIGGTATNAGFVEIATADDGTEPIYVRQYTGVFTTIARTLTLLDGSGNTTFPGTVTGVSFTGSSDERLKTNIHTISDPLLTIEKLRGVSFDRISNKSKDYGVIAQEIEQVLPDIVHTDAEGYKSVSYDSIIGFLIEGMKHQQEKINQLENKIEEILKK